MLQVSQLHQYYGGSHILRGVDFSARQGEVTCRLGRKGVGKTTLLKCLMGLIPARSGEVRWQDQNITHRKPGAELLFDVVMVRACCHVVLSLRFFLSNKRQHHACAGLPHGRPDHP